MATVTSFGAAQTVTGSCHLVRIGHRQILVDCGMFQGDGGSEKNEAPFGFDPAAVDFLLLTHAHIDHIGRAAKLAKEGFRGQIVSTEPTRDIAKIMLLDSAKILSEEYATQQKKARRKGMEESVKTPLYTEEDVEALFDLPWHTLAYAERFSLDGDISLSLGNAGHIMGSAFVLLDFAEDGTPKRLAFSGDLGSPHRLILDSADRIDHAEALFIESTYGDRCHKPLRESVAEFKRAVSETLEREGNVIIPSFALERTQEVLWLLHKMFHDGELPECRVFLDSPLAIKATTLYNRYPIHLNDEVSLHSLGDKDPFSFPQLELSMRRKESMAINGVDARAIIIAGSGMCTGGRVLHHLKHRLWNPDNAVIFVGFQVEGTLGRRLVDGAEFVNIYGEEIIVKAQVHTINGFSAHADQRDLIDWIRPIKDLEKLCLIHGEAAKMKVFATAVKAALGYDAYIMEQGLQLEI